MQRGVAFKVSLSYIVSLKPGWATKDPVKGRKERRKKDKKEGRIGREVFMGSLFHQSLKSADSGESSHSEVSSDCCGRCDNGGDTLLWRDVSNKNTNTAISYAECPPPRPDLSDMETPNFRKVLQISPEPLSTVRSWLSSLV